MKKIESVSGEKPPILEEKPPNLDPLLEHYLKAFFLMNESRKSQFNGMTLNPLPLELSDLLLYAREFPDDVDDKRHFIRVMQAIDKVFLEHGTRQSKT